jgi:homogentisate 1,2-dioxygenase
VSGLEAYASYILHLDASFESVAWDIRSKTIRVVIDPNQFKVLEIPVAIFGEVTGMVYIKEDSSSKPQGRIIVCFFRSDKSMAGQAITEADGSFDLSGLAPGNYTAEISPGQLEKLHMLCRPRTLPFKILAKKDGDVAEGLEFILQSH